MGLGIKIMVLQSAHFAKYGFNNTFCFSLGICQDVKEFIEKRKNTAETRDYSEPMRALRI